MLSLAAIAFVLAASGCARFSGMPPPYGAESAARSETATSPIKHVVIIVQENRSFDHYFSGYPGANSATSGMHGRKVIKLQRATFAAFGFGHSYGPAVSDIDGGKMDDFELATPKPPAPPINAYAYMDRSKIVPYWTMAEQYVLSDAMFSTELGPSFTAHQMIVAGTTEVSPTASIVDLPYGLPGDCLAPPGKEVTSLLTIHKKLLRNAGPAPCFTYPTIVDDLDPAGISWKYYYPAPSNLLWNAFQSIKKVALGPDKSNVVTAPTQVLLDAKGGHLAGVSWVIPDFLNSDHPAAHSNTGPSWVASVVNAIGRGPDWNSTMIIVVWDDWGGWYDHVPPPQKYYYGLGLRVPCLIISPYAREGYVDHTQYEFGSVLRTIEDIFKLRSLGTTDATSNTMIHALDFTLPPRPFKVIPSDYTEEYFLRQRPSHHWVDDE